MSNQLTIPGDVGEVSDGFHTFNELYQHRQLLFVCLINQLLPVAWKSHTHQDGSMFPGWFIAGIELPTGQITYHMELQYWDLCLCQQQEFHEWDGHSAKNVVARLQRWAQINLRPLSKEQP